MTVLDIIKSSLRLIRVIASGENPSAEDSQDAFNVLIMMLSEWSNEGLMLYADTNFDGAVTGGTGSYSIGEDYALTSVTGTWRIGKYVYGNTSGAVGKLIAKGDLNHYTISRLSGTFAAGETILEWDNPTSIGAATAQGVLGTVPAWQTSRPDSIDTAFIRQNGIDYPLKTITNEQYQSIADKTVQSSIPEYLLLDTAYPNATVRLHPVPSEAVTVRISYRGTLGEYTGLTDTISLPDGYEQALRYNLAIELAPEYGNVPDAIVMKRAIDTKSAIKGVNHVPIYSAVDNAISGNGEQYNFYIGN